MDEYIDAAGIGDDKQEPLFRSSGQGRRQDVLMRNGGDLEIAARIAGHESTRTTQLYNRTHEELSLDEIERIHI